MIRKRFGFVVTSLAVIVSLLAGCGGSSGSGSNAGSGSGANGGGQPSGGSAAPAVQRGELRIAMQYDMGLLDPQVLSLVTDKQMAINLYNGLVRYKLGTVEVEPDLAEKWETSDDGLEWVFNLRKGVQFHKGYGEMKASDVKFTFDRLLDPELKSPNAALLAGLKTDVVDESTIKFTLAKPDAAFLDKLANSFSWIVSEKAVNEKGDKFAQDPIGTGPYMFDNWSPQQETVYVSNDEYFRGKPGLAKVIYVPIPDPTTMYNAFEAGDVDMIQVTSPDKLLKYRNDSNVVIDETPGLITRFMGMNTIHKPFDDKRVRQAVLHAVQKSFIIDHVFQGISTEAKSILAPAVQHSEQDVVQYEYDLEKAKALLAEAGYPDGFTTTLGVPNVDRFTTPATVIQDNLKQIGINVEITVMETQAFLAELQSAAGVPMFILSRGQDATPDRVLYTWHHSGEIPANNWANIRDPEVDEWLDGTKQTIDQNVRKELFSKVQKRIVEDAYYLYLDHENQIYALQKHVQGFVGDPQRSIRLDNVTVGK